MKIFSVSYRKTGEDSHRHEVGVVTVTFSNACLVDFEEVRRDALDAWAETGYDPERTPYEMSWPFQQHWLQFVRQEAEREEGRLLESAGLKEDDIEALPESEIRDDDYLGQVTGIPTPGFEPETTGTKDSEGTEDDEL